MEVPTLDGIKTVKVPPGTQSHVRLRLKEMGVPRFRGDGRGDQYVRVIVKVPRKLTDRARKLVEELKREGL